MENYQVMLERDRNRPPFTWEETKKIIDSNQLAKFSRSEKGAREYAKHKDELEAQDINPTSYLLAYDLNWIKLDKNNNIVATHLLPNSSRLFHDPQDVKIVLNRFPYNFEAGIKHLLVWTKIGIKSDPASNIGDISQFTRNVINRYIEKTFVEYLGIERDNIRWFRNWSALQSIKDFSHIHVLINGISEEQLGKILNTAGKVLEDEDYIQLERGSRI